MGSLERVPRPLLSGVLRTESIAPGMSGPTYVRTWREDAACRGMDVDLFFGPEVESARAHKMRVASAKTVCMSCPVRVQCLDYANEIQEAFGVWGGLTTEERMDRKLGNFMRCANGHPLVEGSVYVDKDGIKRCRACRREAARKLRAAR